MTRMKSRVCVVKSLTVLAGMSPVCTGSSIATPSEARSATTDRPRQTKR